MPTPLRLRARAAAPPLAALIVGLITVPGLLAGCGGHTAGAAGAAGSSTPPAPVSSAPASAAPTPTTVASVSSTAVPTTPSTSAPRPTTAPTTPSSHPAAPAAACTSAQIAFSLGGPVVSGGRTSVHLLLHDTATAACVLRGWPAVDVVAASGMQVGPAAAQAPGTAATVTLAGGGGTATATFSYVAGTASSPAACEAQQASGLLVFAPGQTSSTQVRDSLELCTDQADRPTVTVVSSGP